MQSLIAAQQTCMSEAFGANQDGHQKRDPGGGWLDVVRRLPSNGQVLADLLYHSDLPQIGEEDGGSAEWRHRSSSLTQNQALARQQSGDFLRN